MVQTEFEIIEDDVEFIDGIAHIPVYISEYVEEKVGTSRDEEYFERTTTREDVVSVECPVKYIYDDSDPSTEYTGDDAIEFIIETNWDSVDVVDVETVELIEDGDLWIASLDTTELEEYR